MNVTTSTAAVRCLIGAWCLAVSAPAFGQEKDAPPPKNPKIETLTAKYADGATMEVREIYLDATGRKVNHGLYRFYFDNGKTREEVYYKHGKRQGPCIFRHRNGEKECEVEFVDDLRQGIERWYTPEAVKYAEFEHRDDVADGLWVWFYPDGKKVLEEKWVSGVRSGDWVWSFPNGTVGIRGKYLEDAQDGTWSYFDEAGKLIETRTYRAGELLNPPKLNPPAEPGDKGRQPEPATVPEK